VPEAPGAGALMAVVSTAALTAGVFMAGGGATGLVWLLRLLSVRSVQAEKSSMPPKASIVKCLEGCINVCVPLVAKDKGNKKPLFSQS
jgi:hypothetical protein